MTELDRLIYDFRRAVEDRMRGGPPGDGQWAYPEDLATIEQRAEQALRGYLLRQDQ